MITLRKVLPGVLRAASLLLLGVGMGAALLGEGRVVHLPPRAGLSSPTEDTAFVYELLEEHNKVRAQHNLPPLKLSYELQKSALLKAYDMYAYQYWAHFNPQNNTNTPWFFIKQYYPTYRVAGENLGRGFETGSSLMQAWMHSKTHRDNILNPAYTHIGIARLHGTIGNKTTNVVVVHFASGDAATAYTGDAPVPNNWVLYPNKNDAVTGALFLAGLFNKPEKVTVKPQVENGAYVTTQIKPTTNNTVVEVLSLPNAGSKPLVLSLENSKTALLLQSVDPQALEFANAFNMPIALYIDNNLVWYAGDGVNLNKEASSFSEGSDIVVFASGSGLTQLKQQAQAALPAVLGINSLSLLNLQQFIRQKSGLIFLISTLLWVAWLLVTTFKYWKQHVVWAYPSLIAKYVIESVLFFIAWIIVLWIIKNPVGRVT